MSNWVARKHRKLAQIQHEQQAAFDLAEAAKQITFCDRTSDQGIKLGLSSTRAASAFEQALTRIMNGGE